MKETQKAIGGKLVKELDAQALNCGYRQVCSAQERAEGTNWTPAQQVTLEKEHGCYHVKYVDYNRIPTTQELAQPNVMDRTFYMEWHSYPSLKTARAKYAEFCKILPQYSSTY